MLSKKGLMTEKSGVVQNNSNPEWSPGDAEWEFELVAPAFHLRAPCILTFLVCSHGE